MASAPQKHNIQHTDDRYTVADISDILTLHEHALLIKQTMRMMGFIKPYNVGPAWFSNTKPDANEVVEKLSIPFDHLIPAHGEPVIGQASKKYEPAIQRLLQN